MAFSNPIVGGGGALVRSSIHSPDYVAGVSGWTVNRDGSSEFNEGTFRGNIIIGNPTGLRVAIEGSAIQLFDASNVLVAQIDASEIVVISTGGSVQMSPGSQPQIDFNLDADGGHTFFPAAILQYETGTPHYQPALSIASANVDTKAEGQMYILGESVDGGSSFPFGTAGFLFQGDKWVILPTAGGTEGIALNVTKPGIYRYSGGIEDWQALTLQNSWTNRGGSDVTAQYRRIASPPNSVEIVGYISGGTKTDGTTLFTLPAAYRPTHNQVFTVYTNTVVSGRMCLLQVNTDGTCQIFFLGTSTPAAIGFHCIISLDA